MLVRFDLRVSVDRPGVDEILDGRPGESSADVAARVGLARRRALERSGVLNADLSDQELDDLAPLDAPAASALRHELERGRLTARGYHRVRRVARTLADLAGCEGPIGEGDVVAALSMRTRFGSRTLEEAA